jgi:hypothetical protein
LVRLALRINKCICMGCQEHIKCLPSSNVMEDHVVMFTDQPFRHRCPRGLPRPTGAVMRCLRSAEIHHTHTHTHIHYATLSGSKGVNLIHYHVSMHTVTNGPMISDLRFHQPTNSEWVLRHSDQRCLC